MSNLPSFNNSGSKDKFTFLGGGTLPRVLEMPGLKAIDVKCSGSQFEEFKEYKSRFLSLPSH